MKVAIIGGGAAGFFSAIAVKENFPNADVVILEKSQKLLSKVKISGGGRCNVTNGTHSISELARAYPRGGKKLKKLFNIFNNRDCIQWFEDRQVPLMTQEDNCVFPVSQESQSIIDCFMSEARKKKIQIKTGYGVKSIHPENNQIRLTFLKDYPEQTFHKIIVATGGAPKRSGLDWLEKLDLHIVDPVPSLFTFNMPSESITSLMGIVVENALTKIPGTKLSATGPLLITHWGMSGPAILKLSAFGARWLNECNYDFQVQVNWVNIQNNNLVMEDLKNLMHEHAKKQLVNFRPYALPQRLWDYLLDKAHLSKEKLWQDLGKSGVNKLTNLLCNDLYQVKGKTTFKEEFVTAGGIGLDNINFKTMSSTKHPNIYFAGELLDIDGITGGYNFQAAWTTAFVAGQLQEL